MWEERQPISVADLTRQEAVEFLVIARELGVTTAVTPYPLACANDALADLRRRPHRRGRAGAVAGLGRGSGAMRLDRPAPRRWAAAGFTVETPQNSQPIAISGYGALDGARRLCGLPATIRVEQQSEFVSRDLDLWAYQRGVMLDFSRPGKPTDNAFIESFNGRFRAECLNARWFMSLDDAR